MAAGFYDGFWKVGLNPVGRRGGQRADRRKAGGLIGDLSGEGDFLHGGQVIAATPRIFAQMVTALAPFRADLVRDIAKAGTARTPAVNPALGPPPSR